MITILNFYHSFSLLNSFACLQNISMKKIIIIKSFFIVPLVLATLMPWLAEAVDPDTKNIMPAQNIKKVLMPNLTVNFQLNSTLGSKETAYYSRIVEKMLEDMPRKLKLEGDESNLLSGSNNYDTLKIVAYLPPVDEELSDNPLNKIVKRFDISFELPRAKKLERLANATTDETAVINQNNSYTEFMSEVGLMSAGVSPTDVMKASTLSPVMDKSVIENVVKSASDLPAVQGKTKPIVKVKKDLILKYFDNSSTLSQVQKDKLDTLAGIIKNTAIQNIKITTQTAASPFELWTEVRDLRVKYLTKTLKKMGVTLDKLNVSFIHLKSQGRQFIRLDL